ncbi:MAG: hypothetical protein SCH70_11190 [Candidatus Methanoperedens sp.]|nr:hypothetical protein [Candidatus Methanoperedens sp.]
MSSYQFGANNFAVGFLDSRNSLFPIADEVLQLFQSHKTDIYDINRIDKIINEELSCLNWPVSVSMCNDGGNISFQISGTDSEINLFSAILISAYCASHSRPLKIVENLIYPASVYMQFSEASSREEAFEIAERYFSGIKVNTGTYLNNCMSQEPAENMEYWKNIFRHIDVTTACHIHTCYQEDNELF